VGGMPDSPGATRITRRYTARLMRRETVLRNAVRRHSTQRNVSPVSIRPRASRNLTQTSTPRLSMPRFATRCIAAERNNEHIARQASEKPEGKTPTGFQFRLPTSPKGRRNPQLEP